MDKEHVGISKDLEQNASTYIALPSRDPAKTTCNEKAPALRKHCYGAKTADVRSSKNDNRCSNMSTLK